MRDFIGSYTTNQIFHVISTEMFSEEFNTSFGYPRKHICYVNRKFIVDSTKSITKLNEETVKKLKTEVELHLTRAQVKCTVRESERST